MTKCATSATWHRRHKFQTENRSGRVCFKIKIMNQYNFKECPNTNVTTTKCDGWKVPALIISMVFLIGISSASMDTVSHHYAESWFATLGNDQFYDPAISWTNKYKNGDPTQGDAYLFASTWLSWTTDFWHLSKFMLLNFVTVISLAAIRNTPTKWWQWIVAALVLRGAFQIAFTLLYQYIFT